MICSEFEDEQCKILDHQSTATVPGEVSVTDLCDHLQSEELYEDTSPPVPHQQICQYGSQDPEQHNNGYLLENQHPIRYSEPALEPDPGAYSRSSHDALYGE